MKKKRKFSPSQKKVYFPENIAIKSKNEGALVHGIFIHLVNFMNILGKMHILVTCKL
jgi:hypothetical protein